MGLKYCLEMCPDDFCIAVFKGPFWDSMWPFGQNCQKSPKVDVNEDSEKIVFVLTQDFSTSSKTVNPFFSSLVAFACPSRECPVKTMHFCLQKTHRL